MVSVRDIHTSMEKGEVAAPAPLLHGYERSVSSDKSVLNEGENKKNLLACQGVCNNGEIESDLSIDIKNPFCLLEQVKGA